MHPLVSLFAKKRNKMVSPIALGLKPQFLTTALVVPHDQALTKFLISPGVPLSLSL